MKALAVLVLRYKRPEAREWKVPLNFRIGNTEIPVGLILITVTLFLLAITNVVTKKTATISGSIFTVVFFTAFTLSEAHNRRKRSRAEGEQEKFRLDEQPDISKERAHVRPGNILVEVRRPDQMEHLKRVLKEVKPEEQDVVVVAVHHLGPMASSEYRPLAEQICTERELELFSKAVSVAEKEGKHVELLTVPGRDSCEALVQTAQKLESSRIVTTPLPNQTPDDQAREVGKAWEALPTPRPALTLEVVPLDGGEPHMYALGPHPPRLWPSDVELVHRLWQELSDRPGIGGRLHHRDVVGVALRRLDQELHSKRAKEVLADIERELNRPPEKPVKESGEDAKPGTGEQAHSKSADENSTAGAR